MLVYRLVVVFLLILFSHGLLSAKDRNVGLATSIQSEQAAISMPIWTGKKVTIAPSLGIVYREEVGSDLALGLLFKFYTRTPKKITPYIGARVGALINSPEVGEGQTDWLLGVAFGGDYFLDDDFSLGVEAQLNLTKSDENSLRFGSPDGITINTGAAVTAAVYF